jgi:hypothetical protein
VAFGFEIDCARNSGMEHGLSAVESEHRSGEIEKHL